MKIFLALLLFSVSANALESFDAYSAVRNKNIDYKLYKNASNSVVAGFSVTGIIPPLAEAELQAEELAEQTAEQRASLISDLDLLELPEVESFEILSMYFNKIRDERFLRTDTDFPRRISWLYPDDGCFIRAEMMVTKLEQELELKKMFIFGNLNVKTENAFNKEVSWWYHVAPVVRVGLDTYILDPAINPEAPLLLEEWILKQVDSLEDVELSVCDESTFTPNNKCDKDIIFDTDLLLQYQNYFLDQEWIRQQILQRDPEIVLGDSPPWKLIDEVELTNYVEAL